MTAYIAVVSGLVAGSAAALVPSHGDAVASPWRITPVQAQDIGRSGRIACAGPDRCFAIAGDFRVLSWKGGAWKATNVATGGKDRISCASATYCVVVSKGSVERWNGSRWAHARTLTRHFYPSSTSCVAPTFCMTAGSSSHHFHAKATYLHDGQVTVVKDSSIETAFYAASCTTSSFCLLEGYRQGGPAGQWVWNGSTVSRIAAPPEILVEVSCSSRTFCIALGQGRTASGHVWQWHGRASGWTPVTLPRSGAVKIVAGGVSCASSTACEIVGHRVAKKNAASVPAAWRWDGSTWISQQVPVPQGTTKRSGLAGVDCVSATVCSAVGFVGNAPLAMTTAP